jgi:ribose transport system permease protein
MDELDPQGREVPATAPGRESQTRDGDAAPSATRARRGRPALGDRTAQVDFLARYAVVLVLIAVVVGFSIALPETFFTTRNFQTIAGQQAVGGLIALALLPTLVAGDFDLSVAGTFTLASTVVIGAQINHDLSWEIAIGAALGVGVVVGVVNGITVVRFGINSLIGTLAMATILSGIVNWQTGGAVIYGNVAPTFSNLGRWSVFNIPGSAVYLFAVGVLLWFLLTRTVLGRFLFATGSNPVAARLSGLETRWVRTVGFVITGVVAAFAGILFAANVGSGQPGIGDQFLLPAFAATFLGATTITPGRFNVWGTIVAVYLLGTGLAGLQQEGAPFYVEPIFNGTALLLAVGLSIALRRARAS